MPERRPLRTWRTPWAARCGTTPPSPRRACGGDYGANIGKVLLATYGDDVKIRAKAMAAAGSDARMNGCGLPVVIVSGSGNQGLTASLPVVEYAKELGADWETTLRAVLVSDLITIHLKAEIGRLSAYCGAVSAGCGSGAGIAWLYGREKEPQALLKDVSHTIVNALAVDSGIVCDGAKASCAAKIASAVDAGLLGFYMYQNGQQFRLKGKGVKDLRGSGQGDQLVEVKIEIPKKLSGEEKEMYEKLRKLQAKGGKESVFDKFKKAFK